MLRLHLFACHVHPSLFLRDHGISILLDLPHLRSSGGCRHDRGEEPLRGRGGDHHGLDPMLPVRSAGCQPLRGLWQSSLTRQRGVNGKEPWTGEHAQKVWVVGMGKKVRSGR